MENGQFWMGRKHLALNQMRTIQAVQTQGFTLEK